MIVLDENIHDQRSIDEIASWYPGRVVSLTALRPRSIIKDDAIFSLLQQADHPTFVTINADDFWRRSEPHHGFCVVNLAIPKERVRDAPALLQHLLRLAQFKTRSSRMGKVIRMTYTRVEYYESDLRVQSILASFPRKR